MYLIPSDLGLFRKGSRDRISRSTSLSCYYAPLECGLLFYSRSLWSERRRASACLISYLATCD